VNQVQDLSVGRGLLVAEAFPPYKGLFWTFGHVDKREGRSALFLRIESFHFSRQQKNPRLPFLSFIHRLSTVPKVTYLLIINEF